MTAKMNVLVLGAVLTLVLLLCGGGGDGNGGLVHAAAQRHKPKKLSGGGGGGGGFRRVLQEQPEQYSSMELLTLEELPPCTLTSNELTQADATTEIQPCILYDTVSGTTTPSSNGNGTEEFIDADPNANVANNTAVITIVGIFDSACDMHRDGALVAVEKMNDDNDGKGVAIGYNEDYYLKFRFIVGVPGNSKHLSVEQYQYQHQHLLESLLVDIQPQYILGSCSFFASYDKPLAGLYKTILLSQVGPTGYYTQDSNDYVFGIHIPSDTYGIPAYQALKFSLNRNTNTNSNTNSNANDLVGGGEDTTTTDTVTVSSVSTTNGGGSGSGSGGQQQSQQKIRIIHRDRSEFFYSTCQTIYERAISDGFGNTTKQILYNPDEDSDGNGIVNHLDTQFLEYLGNQVCSAEEANDDIAVWGCLMTDLEINTVLSKIKQNGCRLKSLWLTGAALGWGVTYSNETLYMQGGAQWHQDMIYSDEYFETGQDMINYGASRFGYNMLYGAMGSYHSIYVAYQNIKTFFKTKDKPTVMEVFQTDYEEIRRSLVGMNLPRSLYGPTVFDENRRNVGRGAAGIVSFDLILLFRFLSLFCCCCCLLCCLVVLLPPRVHSRYLYAFVCVSLSQPQQWGYVRDEENGGVKLETILVSPLDQARATIVVPAPVTLNCSVGEYIDVARIQQHVDDGETSPSILDKKCSKCPVDTFQPFRNQELSCRPCAVMDDGSPATTLGKEGSKICHKQEDNLIPSSLLLFGYMFMSIVFALAIVCLSWTVYNRKDPVVQVGQLPFLVLICIGSMLSSSTIIPLSYQAGVSDDEQAASNACLVIPWLYTTGWMLQYSSLSAKSYRMYKMMSASQGARRVAVPASQMYKIVFGALLLNYVVILPWTILDPFTWERTDLGTTSINEELGLQISESYGNCHSNNTWYWISPLLFLQCCIMIITNAILYMIRNVSDRYQESKYVGMASLYACEFLILGIPILIAVGDSTEATHIALCSIVALSDIGILLMIFVPKMIFARQGLPEGLSVGATIMKARTRRSSAMDYSNASSRTSFQPGAYGCQPNDDQSQNMSLTSPTRGSRGSTNNTVQALRAAALANAAVFEPDSSVAGASSVKDTVSSENNNSPKRDKTVTFGNKKKAEDKVYSDITLSTIEPVEQPKQQQETSEENNDGNNERSNSPDQNETK